MKKDKLLHFIAGVIIALLFSTVHPVAGLVVAILAGVAKELYDKAKGGLFDWKDLVFTVAGGLFVFISDLLKILNGEWGF